MTTMSSSNVLSASMPAVHYGHGRLASSGRTTDVSTRAVFSKDKKEVERYKKSEVVKAKKLLPFDVKWAESQPGRAFKQDAARNTPRQGGFGQGKPYQKEKIGQKMEGTPVPSNISPIAFVAVLAGVTVALSLALIN